MIPCILLVDDEKGFLNPQKEIIKRYGFYARYTTIIAGIGRVFDKGEIDFIHLDILLDPNAKETDWQKPTGLSEIQKVLMERKLEIPIMIISGHIDEKAVQMAEEEYGLKDLIVKWYNKPVEYEMVVLDTIKEINERKFKRTKELMLNYARASANENYSLIETALTTMPIIKHDITLNPTLLLDILESLSLRLKALCRDLSFKEFRGEGEGDFNKYSKNFKEIVTNHLGDYFRNSYDNHRILAEYFIDLIEKINLQDDKFKTEAVWDSMLDIIELFEKDALGERDVYDARIKIEDILGTHIGFRFDAPGKLNKYLDLVMKRG